MRLDKFLAECGAGSRSEVKAQIRKGLVSVNQTVIKSPEYKVSPETDEVICCGTRLQYEPFSYVMLHKPAGCVTALHDNRHPTVMEYLGNGHRPKLAPVGRLDLDTEGLLLLTDDGALAHRLLAPGSHVDKVYYARVEGCVTCEDVQAFREGLDIGEKRPTLPAELVILSAGEQSEAELTIREGKFHQVKRMFETRGKRVVYLKRISMGGLRLDPALAAGEWRPLTKEEIRLLQDACGVQTQNGV